MSAHQYLHGPDYKSPLVNLKDQHLNQLKLAENGNYDI